MAHEEDPSQPTSASTRGQPAGIAARGHGPSMRVRATSSSAAGSMPTARSRCRNWPTNRRVRRAHPPGGSERAEKMRALSPRNRGDILMLQRPGKPGRFFCRGFELSRASARCAAHDTDITERAATLAWGNPARRAPGLCHQRPAGTAFQPLSASATPRFASVAWCANGPTPSPASVPDHATGRRTGETCCCCHGRTSTSTRPIALAGDLRARERRRPPLFRQHHSRTAADEAVVGARLRCRRLDARCGSRRRRAAGSLIERSSATRASLPACAQRAAWCYACRVDRA